VLGRESSQAVLADAVDRAPVDQLLDHLATGRANLNTPGVARSSTWRSASRLKLARPKGLAGLLELAWPGQAAHLVCAVWVHVRRSSRLV
jgi:hypothetical protein